MNIKVIVGIDYTELPKNDKIKLKETGNTHILLNDITEEEMFCISKYIVNQHHIRDEEDTKDFLLNHKIFFYKDEEYLFIFTHNKNKNMKNFHIYAEDHGNPVVIFEDGRYEKFLEFLNGVLMLIM